MDGYAYQNHATRVGAEIRQRNDAAMGEGTREPHLSSEFTEHVDLIAVAFFDTIRGRSKIS